MSRNSRGGGGGVNEPRKIRHRGGVRGNKKRFRGCSIARGSSVVRATGCYAINPRQSVIQQRRDIVAILEKNYLFRPTVFKTSYVNTNGFKTTQLSTDDGVLQVLLILNNNFQKRIRHVIITSVTTTPVCYCCALITYYDNNCWRPTLFSFFFRTVSPPREPFT